MAFDLGGFLKKRWDTSVIRDAVSSNTAADQQRRQVAAQKAAPVQQPKVPYYGSFSPQVTNTEQAVQQTGRDLGRQQREGQITGQQFNDRFAQLLASTTKDSGYKTPMAQAGNFAKSIVKPFWETGDTVVKGAQLGVANATNNTQAADNARKQRDQSYAESLVRPVSRAASGINSTFNPAQKSAERQLENKLVELRNNTESFTQNKAKEIQDGIRSGIYDPQKGSEAIQELLSLNEGVNGKLGQFYDEKLATVGLTKDMSAAQSYAQIAGDQLNAAGLLISPASGTAIRQAGGNVVRRGISELGTNSALNGLGGAASAYGQGANLEDSLKAGATQAGVGAVMMGAGYLKGPAAIETNIPAAPGSLRESIQAAKQNVRLAINNPDGANVFKINNPLDAKTTGLDINNPMGAQTKPLDVRNPLGAETGKKLSIVDRYKQATDIDAPKQDGFVRNPLANDAPQVGKTDPLESLKQEAIYTNFNGKKGTVVGEKDGYILVKPEFGTSTELYTKDQFDRIMSKQNEFVEDAKKTEVRQAESVKQEQAKQQEIKAVKQRREALLDYSGTNPMQKGRIDKMLSKKVNVWGQEGTLDEVIAAHNPTNKYKIGGEYVIDATDGVNSGIMALPKTVWDRLKVPEMSRDAFGKKTPIKKASTTSAPITRENAILPRVGDTPLPIKQDVVIGDTAPLKKGNTRPDPLTTVSGRKIQLDQYNPNAKSSAADSRINTKWNQTLIEAAIEEAKLRNDSMNLGIFEDMQGTSYKNLSESDMSGIHQYLFDSPDSIKLTYNQTQKEYNSSELAEPKKGKAIEAERWQDQPERVKPSSANPRATQSQPPKSPLTPNNQRTIDSYSTPKPITEYKVGEKVSVATAQGGEVNGTITKTPDFSKDLRIKGNDFSVKLEDGTIRKTDGAGFGDVQSPLTVEKKPFTPISQPVDNIPAIAKRVSEPQQRGFTKSVQEAPNVDTATKKLVNSEYKPKENDALMGEAKALLSEGASIDFKNTKNLDQKVAATIQEAVNAQARGDHAAAAALYNNLSEHGTELGRGVQAFALLENMSPEAVSLSVAGRIKKYNATHRRQIPELDGAQQKQISEKIIAADLLKGREKNIALNELDNLVSSYIPSSFADKAITVWKAGLLTSFRTHERNFIGNAVHGVAETVKDVPASAADVLMSAKTGKRTVTSTVGGVKAGLGAFGNKSTRQQIKDIISKGYDPSEQINKFDYKKITWGNNLVEKGLKGYTEAVFRTLGASDKPFYNSALARSLHNSAAVEAINLGKRGNKAFIENLVKNPSEQMMKDAISDANVATFKNRNQATNVVNDLKRAMNQTEYGKVVAEITMPFTGVPTSILGEIINYSPIGLVKGAAKVGAVTAGKVPDLQRQAAQELGKGVVGTAIFGLGSYLMGQGIMTGQPKDAAEAKQWEVERKPRNSIFIGGKWRSLNSLGPEAVVFLAGAKAQEAKSNPEGSGAEYGLNLGKDYLDQSFVKGLQSPVNALTDPKRYGKSYLGQTASSVVPNIIKDATRALDPTQRETNTVGDYLKNSTPGLSKTLLPRRDSLGNPMAQEPTGVNAFVDLFNSKTPVKGSVIDEMKRLKVQDQDVMPPIIDKKVKIDGTDVQLTDAQRNSLRGSIGKTIQTTWDATIKTPEYRALPVEKQSQTLKNIASDAREAELRRFASRNKLGQYGDNFTGKAGELTVNQANMVNNKFDSTAYTTKTSTGKTKVQSDYDVASSNRSLTMTRAKASNDLNTWIKAAGEEYNAIGEQIKALDPKTDQVKINTLIKKQEALQRTALGHKANGYIKKTTKATGKGSKGGKFTIPTSSVASSARTSTFTNLNRLLAGTTKTNSNKGKIGNKVALRKITVKGVKS